MLALLTALEGLSKSGVEGLVTLEILFFFESGQIFLEKAIDVFRKILILLERNSFKNVVKRNVQLRNREQRR